MSLFHNERFFVMSQTGPNTAGILGHQLLGMTRVPCPLDSQPHFHVVIASTFPIIFFKLTHYREKAEMASTDLAGEKIRTSTLQDEVGKKMNVLL